MTQKRFTYEQIAFDYRLTLETRKTLAIHLFPDQSVHVKAPLHASESKITGFLQRKIRWILKHQRYFAQFKPRIPKEYVSGETFRYLGRNYKLLIRKAEGQERVSLQHGVLTVFSMSPQDRAHTRLLLEAWYLEKARQLFTERLACCLNRFPQLNLPKLGIRRLARRWGSYSRRTHRIGLNLELIKASRPQIDYVLIHELCHTTHRAHDKAFYSLLSSHLPEWKNIKRELECSLLSV
jgi:predicted metal-dependent hydrolase